MVKEWYEKICAGDEVRQSLISLRESIREEENLRRFVYLLDGDFTVLFDLLQEEDPKVRKNAALVLGALESEDVLPILFDAYKKEETLFIRSGYLKAMAELDYRPMAQELTAQLDALRQGSYEPEEWKHISEEIRLLQGMVLRCKGIRKHRFAGQKYKDAVILLTNREQRQATAAQIEKGTITLLAGGLRVQGVPLKELLSIRTYTELLLPIEAGELPFADPVRCGQQLSEPVLALANALFHGEGTFLFRLELRGDAVFDGVAKQDARYAQKKGDYIRRLSDEIERESQAQLVNSVSEYELEVRLILKKDGTFVSMLKPGAGVDNRFSYRKEVVAASMAPTNAALAVRLAEPYLKEGAQVLDPFCGVATLLVERARLKKTGSMYGVDNFREAIEKGRRNARRAKMQMNLINRDFFTFRHEYLFDEVITDFPTVVGDGSKRELRRFYQDFFDAVLPLLKEEAVLVLYSQEPNYILENLAGHQELRLEKKFILNEKNQTTLFVVKRG